MMDVDGEKVKELCNPLNYLGASQIMVDRVLEDIRR